MWCPSFSLWPWSLGDLGIFLWSLPFQQCFSSPGSAHVYLEPWAKHCVNCRGARVSVSWPWLQAAHQQSCSSQCCHHASKLGSLTSILRAAGLSSPLGSVAKLGGELHQYKEDRFPAGIPSHQVFTPALETSVHLFSSRCRAHFEACTYFVWCYDFSFISNTRRFLVLEQPAKN